MPQGSKDNCKKIIFQELSPNFCTAKKEGLHYVDQIVALTVLQDGPGMPVFNEVTTDFIPLNGVRAKSVGCLDSQLQEVIHKVSNHLSSYLLSLHCLIYEYVNYIRLKIHDRKSIKVTWSLGRSIVSRRKSLLWRCAAAGIQWYVMSSLWIFHFKHIRPIEHELIQFKDGKTVWN